MFQAFLPCRRSIHLRVCWQPCCPWLVQAMTGSHSLSVLQNLPCTRKMFRRICFKQSELREHVQWLCNVGCCFLKPAQLTPGVFRHKQPSVWSSCVHISLVVILSLHEVTQVLLRCAWYHAWTEDVSECTRAYQADCCFLCMEP